MARFIDELEHTDNLSITPSQDWTEYLPDQDINSALSSSPLPSNESSASSPPGSSDKYQSNPPSPIHNSLSMNLWYDLDRSYHPPIYDENFLEKYASNLTIDYEECIPLFPPITPPPVTPPTSPPQSSDTNKMSKDRRKLERKKRSLQPHQHYRLAGK